MSLVLVRGSVATGSCDITPGRCLDRMVFHDICSVICNDGRHQAVRKWRIVSRRVRGTKRNWADNQTASSVRFLPAARN
jgi:hypothetical protein